MRDKTVKQSHHRVTANDNAKKTADLAKKADNFAKAYPTGSKASGGAAAGVGGAGGGAAGGGVIGGTIDKTDRKKILTGGDLDYEYAMSKDFSSAQGEGDSSK